MNYRTLGRTGLRCSEIGLGTWAFASQIYGDVAESDAHATVRAALDAGINLFDTAPLYGDREQDGIAETILGEALGAHRSEVLISSKFGRLSTDNAVPHFEGRYARASVEGSLRRLGRDHLDVLFFHSPFGAEDIHDDVWETLAALQDEGKVRYLGHSISMFENTQQMARDWAAERRIDVVQVVYSLMNRASASLIEDLGAQGVGVFARESLANGFLSGRITADTVFPPGHLNSRYSRDEVAERAAYVDRLAFLLRGDVQTVPQAAFRWVLDNPHVSLVLSGARNARELADAVRASGASRFTAEEHDRAAALHQKDFQAA